MSGVSKLWMFVSENLQHPTTHPRNSNTPETATHLRNTNTSSHHTSSQKQQHIISETATSQKQQHKLTPKIHNLLTHSLNHPHNTPSELHQLHHIIIPYHHTISSYNHHTISSYNHLHHIIIPHHHTIINVKEEIFRESN